MFKTKIVALCITGMLSLIISGCSQQPTESGNQTHTAEIPETRNTETPETVVATPIPSASMQSVVSTQPELSEIKDFKDIKIWAESELKSELGIEFHISTYGEPEAINGDMGYAFEKIAAVEAGELEAPELDPEEWYEHFRKEYFEQLRAMPFSSERVYASRRMNDLEEGRVNDLPEAAIDEPYFYFMAYEYMEGHRRNGDYIRPDEIICLIMMSDNSRVNSGGDFNYASNMDDETIKNQIEVVFDTLTSMSGGSIIFTDEPARANTVIKYCISYPSAGAYEEVPVYGCDLSLEAYSIQTGEFIAETNIKNRPGRTISVEVGVSIFVSDMPELTDNYELLRFSEYLIKQGGSESPILAVPPDNSKPDLSPGETYYQGTASFGFCDITVSFIYLQSHNEIYKVEFVISNFSEFTADDGRTLSEIKPGYERESYISRFSVVDGSAETLVGISGFSFSGVGDQEASGIIRYTYSQLSEDGDSIEAFDFGSAPITLIKSD